MDTINGKTQNNRQSKCLIVLPCFNAGGKITRALKSVATINLDSMLVIVDDGSTDNTIEILRQPEVSPLYTDLIIHSENRGVSAARNTGLEWGKNKNIRYVLFLDADDHFIKMDMNHHLAEKSDFHVFESYETLDCYSDAMSFGKFISKKNTIPSQDIAQICSRYAITPNKVSVFTSCWAKVFDARLIYKINLKFNEKMKTFEDVDFNYRYLRNCRDITLINAACYAHTNPKNRSQTGSFGGGSRIIDLFGFVWAIRSFRNFAKTKIPNLTLNFHGLFSAYYAISLMRAGRKVNSWASFWDFYKFIKKRTQKTYVQRAIRSYNVRQAGGRQILASLVKMRYSMSLTLYIILMVQIERFREVTRWKKLSRSKKV